MGCTESKPAEPEPTNATTMPVAAAPSAAQATVDKSTIGERTDPIDKATYVKWEADVIKKFYTSEQKQTEMLPMAEQIAVVRKVKYILVVDACDEEGSCFSEKVGSGVTEGLPEHQHVQLWHLNKRKNDGVRFGHDVANDIFKHPACDLGGLTNLRQKLGEPVAFAGTAVPWGAGTETKDAAESVAEQLVAQWQELLPGKDFKKLVPSLVQDITNFVNTVNEATVLGSVMLRLHLLPTEHRVLVTHTAVKEATGHYYVRVYGDDKMHAKASSGKYTDKDGNEKAFYCGVTETYVTSNLNMPNLEMECVKYPEAIAIGA